MNETRYLTEKEVSQLTGIAISTLRNNRFMRKGFPYYKIGKCVRYSLSEIYNFMTSKKINTEEKHE